MSSYASPGSAAAECKRSIIETVTDPLFFELMPKLGFIKWDDVRDEVLDKRWFIDLIGEHELFRGYQTIACRARSECCHKYGDITQTVKNKPGSKTEPEDIASKANLLLFAWCVCACTIKKDPLEDRARFTEIYLIDRTIMKDVPIYGTKPNGNGQLFGLRKPEAIQAVGGIIDHLTF